MTRYHSVRKEFEYTAKKLSQSLNLVFKTEFDLLNKKHSIEFEKDFIESIIVHDYDMPNIDLHPPKRKSLDQVGKLWEKYSDEIADDYKDKLIKVWEASY